MSTTRYCNYLGTNPWGAQLPRVDFNIVVVDSCPYDSNRDWCPLNVGDTNRYGFEYHFDLVRTSHYKTLFNNKSWY